MTGRNLGLIFGRLASEIAATGMAATPIADRRGHRTPEKMGVIVAHSWEEPTFSVFRGRVFGQEKKKRTLRTCLKLIESRGFGGFPNESGRPLLVADAVGGQSGRKTEHV